MGLCKLFSITVLAVFLGVCVQIFRKPCPYDFIQGFVFPPVLVPDTVPIVELVSEMSKFHMEKPEDFVFGSDEKGEYIITGLGTGYVVKVYEDDPEEIVNLLTPNDFGANLPNQTTHCDGGIFTENACGRPLGMKYDRSGESLLIANAYFGIFRYYLKENRIERLVSDGGTFYNDVCEAPDGRIYFTLSSKRFYRYQVVTLVLSGDETGSFNAYDPETGEVQVIADNLPFANGVLISKDEKSIYVALTSKSEIRRYNIESGMLEKFAEGIPQLVDNMHLMEETGNFLVGGMTRDGLGIKVLQMFTSSATIMKQVLKLPPPLYVLPTVMLLPKRGVFCEVSGATGEVVRIVKSPKDKDGSGSGFGLTSAVAYHDGYFYSGSWLVKELSKYKITEEF